jgi:aryl-alcohol dehydrogenase-like predicted oxidoreductase
MTVGRQTESSEASQAESRAGQTVKRRSLGTTGLEVSEIGFGGHSWSYARVPGDGDDHKPFARGALLPDRDAADSGPGLARDMLAFVLENELVDSCICGVHTGAHVRANFSASWTRLTPSTRRRLDQMAARTWCNAHGWLERGWLC